MQSKFSGRAYAFAAVFLMSLAPIVVKFGFRQALDPIPLLTLRLWLASAVLWLFFWFTDRSAFKLPRKFVLPMVVSAAIFGTSFVLYYLALSYIDASIAHMLVAVSPAVVLLMLALDGRRIGLPSMLRMILVLVGLYLLVGPGGEVNLAGVFLGIGMAITYAAYLFLVEKWLPDLPAKTVTLYTDTIIAVLLTVLYAVWYGGQWQPMPTTGWLIIIFTGIFTTALAHFFYVSSVKVIGSGETALINPLETVFTVVWAMIFLGDRLSLLQWLGGGLILISAFLIGRYNAIAAPESR